MDTDTLENRGKRLWLVFFIVASMLAAACSSNGTTHDSGIEDADLLDGGEGGDADADTDTEPDADDCTPITCDSLAALYCGTTDDQCGGTLTCECEAPLTCGGGGVANECGEGSALDIVITPSRTSGVVPLAVFFDTTDTPTFSDGSFVDATVQWDFDVHDTNSSGRYQEASGFIAAHVFEQPGTYLVRAQVYDAQGRTGFQEVTIEAEDFSGTTYYVAAPPLGSDSNDGTSMESPVASVQHALVDLAQPNTRILFRNGDTFETTRIDIDDRTGPVIISSYSDLNNPSDELPILFSTAVDSDWSTLSVSPDDWRIMDLRIRSGGTTTGDTGPRYPNAVQLAGTNNLLYRVEMDQLGVGVVSIGDSYNTVAECNMHHFSSAGFWSTNADETVVNQGHALIGNWVHDVADSDRAEHVFRLQGGDKVFVAFNHFEAEDFKSNITIRGDSQQVVVYHNILDRNLTFQPQNATGHGSDEYVHHCVADSNLFIGREYDNGYGSRYEAIRTVANDIAIRNNVIYDYGGAISIASNDTVGPSQRIRIHHNTVIGIAPNSTLATIEAGCDDVSLTNNILFNSTTEEPSVQYDTLVTVINEYSAETMVSDWNMVFGQNWDNAEVHFFVSSLGFQTLTEWQTATSQDLNSLTQDPSFDGLDPVTDLDGSFARPSSDSPALDSGNTVVGTALDFYGNLRPENPTRGAVEPSDQEPPIPW